MENNLNQNDEKDFVRPLRTYQDDVADLVKDNKISTAKIVLAEQKRRLSNPELAPEPDSNGSGKKVMKVIFAILLFVLGGGVLWSIFAFGLIPESINPTIAKFEEENKIIKTEEFVEVRTTNKTNAEVKNILVNEISKIQTGDLDKVMEFNILKDQIDEEGKVDEVKINAKEFFGILNTNASDKLIRSLDPDFLYGVYKDSEVTPFIIIKTSDINITFAEMFEWEGTIYRDLKDFLDLKPEVPDFLTQTVLDNENDPEATTTKTVLVENTEPQFSPTIFTDIVLSNRDARTIADEEGNIILIYSFIDDQNIIFTKNSKVFRQLIQRLSTQKLLR